jgi:hypothetical protein
MKAILGESAENPSGTSFHFCRDVSQEIRDLCLFTSKARNPAELFIPLTVYLTALLPAQTIWRRMLYNE